MTNPKLERRVALLEEQVAEVKKQLRSNGAADVPWWERIRGTFRNDAAFRAATRLGRAYRRSTRQKQK